jgi:hypothetical protein
MHFTLCKYKLTTGNNRHVYVNLINFLTRQNILVFKFKITEATVRE